MRYPSTTPGRWISVVLTVALMLPMFAASPALAETPVTTLAASPAAPNGNDGWYTTAPTITLTSSITTATTYFAWGDAEDDVYTSPLTASEGVTQLSYYSVSENDTETAKTADFKVDTASPGAPAVSLGTVTANSIALSWGAIVDATSGTAHYRIYRNGVEIGTATGTSYTAQGLNELTEYTFAVVAVDVAGNESAQSSEVSATTSDATAPETLLSANPSTPDGDNGWYTAAPSITLSTEPGATTFYRWGEGTPVTYSGAITVPEGINTLSYYSVDAANNAENEKTAQFKVDSLAPAAPVLSHGEWTENTVDLSWSAVVDPTSATSGYRIYRDGVLLGTVTGTSYTATGLTEGQPYQFTVRTVDGAGNESQNSNVVDVTIDVTAPETSLSADPTTPSGNNGWYTVAPSITLSTEPGATTYYRWGADSYAIYSGAITAPEGEYTLSYYSVDSHDNAETTKTASFKVDTVRPSDPVLMLDFVGTTAVTISWSPITDVTSHIDYYRVYKNGVEAATTDLTSFTAEGLSGETPYEFTVEAVDLAGNVSVLSNPITVTIDTTAPTTSLTVLPATIGTNGWYRSVPQITLSRNEAGATFYAWNGGANQPYSDTPFSPPLEGTNALSYYSVDASNNAETPKPQTFKVDTGKPTKPALVAPAAVKVGTVSLSWQPSTDTVSGLSHYVLYVDGQQKPGTLAAATNSYMVSGLTPGKHTFRLDAFDLAGNSTASDTKSTAVDGVAPIAKVSTPSISTNSSTTRYFKPAWSATDAAPSSGVVSYDVQYKIGAGGTARTWLTNTPLKTKSFAGTTGLTYYFRVRARDAAGNVSGYTAWRSTIVPYDQTKMTRLGTWRTSSSTSYYYGSVRYTDAKSTAIGMNVTNATAAYLITTKARNRSKVAVFRDNKYVRTINLYSSTTKHRQSVYLCSLSKGTHSVILVNLPSSTRKRLVVDGLAARR